MLKLLKIKLNGNTQCELTSVLGTQHLPTKYPPKYPTTTTTTTFVLLSMVIYSQPHIHNTRYFMI